LRSEDLIKFYLSSLPPEASGSAACGSFAVVLFFHSSSEVPGSLLKKLVQSISGHQNYSLYIVAKHEILADLN
jgi:hypothetical protein